MFWRKKKESEKVRPSEMVRQICVPPSFYECKLKTEYSVMCRIILDAEKYDMDDQLEVRNALLIELKNSIDRVLECPPVKDYEKIRANREDRPPIQERRVIYERIEALNEFQRGLAPREEVFIWLDYKNELLNPSGLPKFKNPPPPPPPPSRIMKEGANPTPPLKDRTTKRN